MSACVPPLERRLAVIATAVTAARRDYSAAARRDTESKRRDRRVYHGGSS